LHYAIEFSTPVSCGPTSGTEICYWALLNFQ